MVEVALGCSIWLVGIWVGRLLLVFVVVVVVGSMYLWLLVGGGWCGGCGWVCGSCGGLVVVVVITLGGTERFTFLCDILSSSFSLLTSFLVDSYLWGLLVVPLFLLAGLFLRCSPSGC